MSIKRPKEWRQKEKWPQRHLQKFRQSLAFQRFLEVYDDFIHLVVVPLLACGELFYQRPPTLRCQMPGIWRS